MHTSAFLAFVIPSILVRGGGALMATVSGESEIQNILTACGTILQ